MSDNLEQGFTQQEVELAEYGLRHAIDAWAEHYGDLFSKSIVVVKKEASFMLYRLAVELSPQPTKESDGK